MISAGRLWSLWDLMQNFDAGKLFISIAGLSNLGHGIQLGQQLAIPTGNLENAKAQIDYVVEELKKLDLPVSRASAEEIQKVLYNEVRFEAGHPQYGELAIFDALILGRYRNFTGDLVNRFKDEMGGRVALVLPAKSAQYFAPGKPLFGEDVADKFPDASFEIDEAGKSFAAGRYTACVFHLMRAAENAVSVLGQTIGAAVINKHGETLPWGVIVGNIGAKIEQLQKGAKQDDWWKIHALLHSVNRAYRTKTAHPADKYTEEEAEAAIHATKSFLQEFCGFI